MPTAPPVAAPVVAIDGPGGSGKGTVAQRVAAALGWHLLDSGALYRLVGLAGMRLGVPLDDAAALARLAAALDVRFLGDGGGEVAVLLDGVDATSDIRAESSGEAASRVAAIPAVRQALIDRQRAFRRPPGLVADGRDMGSFIFPDARLKVFLTASVEERARRRHNQLRQKGIDVSLAALSRDMAERDRRDSERTVAPLKPATDARILDSTGMPVEAVVEVVMGWVKETCPGEMRT